MQASAVAVTKRKAAEDVSKDIRELERNMDKAEKGTGMFARLGWGSKSKDSQEETKRIAVAR